MEVLYNATWTLLSSGFPDDSLVKNLPANAGEKGDMGLIPGSGKSPGGGNGNLPQYSCLGNPMDRGIWLKETGLQSMGLLKVRHD